LRFDSTKITATRCTIAIATEGRADRAKGHRSENISSAPPSRQNRIKGRLPKNHDTLEVRQSYI